MCKAIFYGLEGCLHPPPHVTRQVKVVRGSHDPRVCVLIMTGTLPHELQAASVPSHARVRIFGSMICDGVS